MHVIFIGPSEREMCVCVCICVCPVCVCVGGGGIQSQRPRELEREREGGREKLESITDLKIQIFTVNLGFHRILQSIIDISMMFISNSLMLHIHCEPFISGYGQYNSSICKSRLKPETKN